MLVRDAKDVARRWVLAEATTLPGFVGAFFHGSVNWLPDDAELSPTSDVDVMVVLEGASPPDKLGKFRYRDFLLEISYLPIDQLRSADQVLSQYHLAGSFHTPSIIVDPSGQLTALQVAVAKEYAKRDRVYQRCDDARTRVLRNLQSLCAAEPFHDQVTAWLFATGVVLHILLVAGLRNPTVRNRYVATRALLRDYHRPDVYETLLEQLGCAQMSRARAEQHLAALADTFDLAKTVVTTPFFFTADISDSARLVAIDGSRELIARGDHREAVFWMVATYSRCQKVLYHDAPAEVQEQSRLGYRQLLGDLGILSFADLRRRGDQVAASLPQVWAVAEAIIAANPDIEA